MGKVLRGFKFLSPAMTTTFRGQETLYFGPGPDQKWGPWVRHPEPGTWDGQDCGPGRFHFMKCKDARYAPNAWHIWFAEGREILGESNEKFGAVEYRLRRISIKVWHYMLRRGYLREADLRQANLRQANLYGADLYGANLSRANLYGADLARANLRQANLRQANLYGADLRGANLYGTNLRWADLREANLNGADLSRAYLYGADLYGADLRQADLSRANLSGADLNEILSNIYTIWPEGFQLK